MKLHFDTRELVRDARNLGTAKRRIREEWSKTMYAGGARVIDTVVRKHRSAPDTTDTATARRTGALAALYAHKVIPGDGRIELQMGTIKPANDKALKYAAIHEKQGYTVIRPTKAQHLAIPLAAAKTAAGVPRGEPRSFHDTFVAQSKRGNLLIFQKQNQGAPVPLFLLKKSVRVKGRPALRPSLDEVLPWMIEGMQADVSAVLLGR